MLSRIKSRTQYDGAIKRISEKHGNSPALVKALIHVESNFRPNAENSNLRETSIGLGQINTISKTMLDNLGVSDSSKLYEPEYNIEIMNRLIDDLKTRHESITDIISAYNAGSVKTENNTYINSSYVFSVYSKFILYTILGV